MTRRTTHGFLFFGASALLVAVWLLYFLWLHQPALAALVYIGWAILASGLLLIGLAMGTLGAQGRPQPGQDFTHTTVVVEHGIYAAVRHPLYLGWSLMYAAAMCFSQHWLILILGLLGLGCLYLIAQREDEDLVAKFGSAYEHYMRSVPRMNLAAGILRLLRGGLGQSER
jgi:protein-S-isoprenylcysteine O-methyltransferase Ste14